jgi:hypothetical protein
VGAAQRKLTTDPTPAAIQARLGAAGTLGYAEVTANQTTISTETDLTSLTATVTVASARRIEVSTKINSQPSTNDNAAVLRIKESTTNLQLISLVLGRTNASETLTGSVILTPSAGSHTYKLSLQMAVGTGTVDLIASSTNPAFILVEDIGPA